MRPLVALLAILAVGGAILALSAGGSEATSEEQPEYGVGQVRAGSVAALATCGDWNEGTDEQRYVTIEDIHDQLNQTIAEGPTPNIPPEEAYALFERSCSRDYAVGFRLYKLYGRAAAFGLLRQ